MELERKIRLIEVMLYEAEQEVELAEQRNHDRTLKFENGYRSALSNVLDILNSDEFAQIMIDYYTKGE